MLFSQFLDDDLGCASYLVGDEDAGVAVVVDPPLAVEPLLEEAARRGVTVVKTLETHTHADHVSGHGRLALEHGIPVAINPAAAPDYAFEPLEDGARVELGDVVITAVHTPGHRPEHTAFTVADTARSDEPWLVLTGDSLFVGDAARPTWPSSRGRAPRASTARSTGSSTSATASRCSPVTWRARCAAGR